MIDLSNVQTIARKELRDALRNRWFVLYTLAFGGLALALSALSHPGGGLANLAGYGRTAASLVNLVLLFVPLIGLTLGAANLAGERETGALDYLLTQPVTRPEVLLGKYVGLAAALLASLGLGFGLAGVFLALRGQGGDPAGYIVTVLIAWLLGLAMLSLGLLLSIVARRTSGALGAALFLWLVLVFMGDLGIMGAAIITQLPIEQVLLLASLNPLQLFKTAAILTIQANLEVLGPAGLYATDRFGSALLPLLVGGLLIWMVLPLAGALILFVRQGNRQKEHRT
ncbi:MAG: ABC transporter permease subunit [Anaerolineae bacterium]|nr:ABC transporter permease subunit [Anaerolineae bacterium]